MSFLSANFNASGRIDRKTYWPAVAILTAAGAACHFLISMPIFLAGNLGYFAILGWLIGRRMSDFNYSPWWGRIVSPLCITIYFIVVLSIEPIIFQQAIGADSAGDFHRLDEFKPTIIYLSVIDWAPLLAPFCLAFLAGVFPGNPRINRFGPPPNESELLQRTSGAFDEVARF